jgi:hypothetical protein
LTGAGQDNDIKSIELCHGVNVGARYERGVDCGVIFSGVQLSDDFIWILFVIVVFDVIVESVS